MYLQNILVTILFSNYIEKITLIVNYNIIKRYLYIIYIVKTYLYNFAHYDKQNVICTKYNLLYYNIIHVGKSK